MRDSESIDRGRSSEVSKTLLDRTLSRSGEIILGVLIENEVSGLVAGAMLRSRVGVELEYDC